jgi:hypothetical protein
METPIHLHQLSKVRLPLSPLPMCSPSPFSAPQPFLQHPSSQRLNPNLNPVFMRQVLRRQRWSKALSWLSSILFPDQTQHSAP